MDHGGFRIGDRFWTATGEWLCTDVGTRTPPLRPGDPYPCPRCRTPHVIEQPFQDRSTAERTHLYITCRGERYFVGQVIRPQER